MGVTILALLALALGALFLAWPDPVLELNDRFSLVPGALSRGYVRFLGVIAILVGLFLGVFQLRKPSERPVAAAEGPALQGEQP